MISRKKVAQVGVVLFIVSLVQGIFLSPLAFIGPDNPILPMLGIGSAGIFVLLIATLLPASDQDEWGSIWPLAGYDNAIDAIYIRGPWLIRLQELDEIDLQRNLTSGITTMFGEDRR